ncbi:MAG: hypothetical protein WDA71_11780 [Actinomycetota bacterium]
MHTVLHGDAPSFVVEAVRILRDPSLFNWYTVTFLGVVLYVYAGEIEKRNWNVVLAGLAFWLMDWINEIINSLWLHFTHYAPIWTTTGDTSYQILVGLNIEICFLFAITGVLVAKQLPPDAKLKVLGIPNRWLFVVGFSSFAVFVEILLNQTGYFGWAYPWWDWPHFWLIIPFGYGTFLAMTVWVHDMAERAKQLKVVGSLAGIVIAALVAFGPILNWI